MDADSARCNECAERAASEGEPRLTKRLHGEREDECPNAGGPVTARLKVVRHDGTLVLRSLHVEFGEWRECERRQHIRLDNRGINECSVGASPADEMCGLEHLEWLIPGRRQLDAGGSQGGDPFLGRDVGCEASWVGRGNSPLGRI